MTLHARFGEINIGGLVWYWCFRDDKRKPGIVLNYEVGDHSAYTFVEVQTHPPNFSQWFKAHSLLLTKDQIDKEAESDGAKNNRRRIVREGVV